MCVSRVFFLEKTNSSSRPTHSDDEVDDDAFALLVVIKSRAASFMFGENIL